MRGEFHRHTDISGDGARVGGIVGAWRYFIDASYLDWAGCCDHDNGYREYPWWRTQKQSDAFHLPGKFVTLFSYERSVRYPEGHRNLLFAQRGIRPLPSDCQGRRRTRPANLRRTRRCSTATSGGSAVWPRSTLPGHAWAPTGATTTRNWSLGSKSTKSTDRITRFRAVLARTRPRIQSGAGGCGDSSRMHSQRVTDWAFTPQAITSRPICRTRMSG